MAATVPGVNRWDEGDESGGGACGTTNWCSLQVHNVT